MRPRKTRVWAILFSLALALSAFGVSSGDAAASPKSRKSSQAKALEGFHSQGRFVRVETVRGVGSGAMPAVLILHGASGLGDGTLFYPQARALAERGISAFIIHYFDGVGNAAGRASPHLHGKRDLVIEDAIGWIQQLPFVDADRIGLFGLSLGGFHALSTASRDVRIAAVVNVIGAMPAPVVREGVWRMPPTLILHGDRDRVVPVRRAYELAGLLERIGAPYEMKIYRGETHYFREKARDDTVRLTAEFFERHLNPSG